MALVGFQNKVESHLGKPRGGQGQLRRLKRGAISTTVLGLIRCAPFQLWYYFRSALPKETSTSSRRSIKRREDSVLLLANNLPITT